MKDNDDIIALQTKLAFQEQAIHELDDALRNQQRQIMKLEEIVQGLRDELMAQRNSGSEILLSHEEPPPPHY